MTKNDIRHHLFSNFYPRFKFKRIRIQKHKHQGNKEKKEASQQSQLPQEEGQPGKKNNKKNEKNINNNEQKQG